MKPKIIAICIIALFAFASALPLLGSAKDDDDLVMVVMELREKDPATATTTSSTEDVNTDTYYELMGYKYTGYSQPFILKTAPYYINTKNKMGLASTTIVTTVNSAASTWDAETAKTVFQYTGSTTRTAGKRDGYNVVDFGSYRSGVIAVTMFWVSGTSMVEIDLRFNTYYKWSTTGESTKMDLQNIATHEFGHWAGLDDIYDSAHSWLTMYGYSNYGITYQRTLCPGDVLGLESVYGP